MPFPDIRNGLPEGTPEFTLPSDHHSIAQLFIREVYRNIDEPDDNPYIIMKNCPPEFVKRIYENPRLYNMPQIRMFYDESARVMVAKKPPDIEQEFAKSIFTQTIIMKMVETQGGTGLGLGLYGELMTTGRTTWDLYVVGRGLARRQMIRMSRLIEILQGVRGDCLRLLLRKGIWILLSGCVLGLRGGFLRRRGILRQLSCLVSTVQNRSLCLRNGGLLGRMGGIRVMVMMVCEGLPQSNLRW